jgi:hypothetical protein
MAVKRVLNQNTKTWFYDFRVRGTRYRGAIPEARNKEQAVKAETRIRNDVFEGRFGVTHSSSRLREFVEGVFLPWAKSNRKSWHKSAPSLAAVVKFFGDKRLQEISPFLIEKFKMVRRSTPVVFSNKSTTGKPVTRQRSVASVNRELAMLSRMFSLAIMNGEAAINPCSKIKKLPGEQHRTRYLLPPCDTLMLPMKADAARWRRWRLRKLEATQATWSRFGQERLLPMVGDKQVDVR